MVTVPVIGPPVLSYLPETSVSAALPEARAADASTIAALPEASAAAASTRAALPEA